VSGWHGLCKGKTANHRTHPMTSSSPATSAPSPWDVARRFVRIVDERTDGLVEFEFAIGEPQLYVEMLMPRAQFEEFCAGQGVVPTHGTLACAAPGTQQHEWDWNLHRAREQRFRHET